MIYDSDSQIDKIKKPALDTRSEILCGGDVPLDIIDRDTVATSWLSSGGPGGHHQVQPLGNSYSHSKLYNLESTVWFHWVILTFMLLKQLPICQIKLPFVSRYVDNPCREIVWLLQAGGASQCSGGGGPSVDVLQSKSWPGPVQFSNSDKQHLTFSPFLYISSGKLMFLFMIDQ